MRFLYGQPVLTISEVVSELNIAQGNVKQNHYMSNLVHAKWIWKDLLWNTDWALTQQVLPVDMDTHTIKLPQNMVRLINISVMDRCGNLQPLAHNPNINTLDIRCPDKTCSCKCGGKGTLCADADNITVTTEVLTINGTDYTQTTYVKYDGQGNMYELINTPTWNVETEEVVYIEQRKLICTLDITEEGCIKSTEPNRRKLVEHCGCFIPYDAFVYSTLPYNEFCGPTCNLREGRHCECEVLIPESLIAHYGFYNWDAQKGDVIHLKHVKADKVIVAYQNNGQVTEDEVLVPEYAVETMLQGIYWRQRFLSPVYSPAEKQVAKMEYEGAKTKLFEFRNPMRMDSFRNAQSTLPKW